MNGMPNRARGCRGRGGLVVGPDPIPAGTGPFEGLVPAETIVSALIPFNYDCGFLGTVACDSLPAFRFIPVLQAKGLPSQAHKPLRYRWRAR